MSNNGTLTILAGGKTIDITLQGHVVFIEDTKSGDVMILRPGSKNTFLYGEQIPEIKAIPK